MDVNRRGMTALVDAMAFMIVMIMAFALTVGYVHSEGGSFSEAGNALDSLCGVELRISDMTELEDDTIVYFTDLMALCAVKGNQDVEDYANAVLSKQCAGRTYCLTMEYMGSEKVLGSPVREPGSSAERELPVSSGGSIRLNLRISS